MCLLISKRLFLKSISSGKDQKFKLPMKIKENMIDRQYSALQQVTYLAEIKCVLCMHKANCRAQPIYDLSTTCYSKLFY